MLMHKGAQLATLVRRVAHGPIVVTNDGLRDEGGEVVVILPANTFNSNSNVGRRDCIIAHTDFGTDKIRLGFLGSCDGGSARSVGRSRYLAEVLFCQLDQLLMRNATCTHKHHAVGGVVGLDVIGQVITRDGLDVFLRAKNSTTERLALVRYGVEVVKHDLLDLLVDLFLLTENDIPLPINGSWFELRILEDIGKDVDGLGDVRVE